MDHTLGVRSIRTALTTIIAPPSSSPLLLPLSSLPVFLSPLSPNLQVVKAQAINILGSVDFLGNPMGLFSDVASGVSGMMSIQPDVVGLVRDVAHGMSDTTSKASGVIYMGFKGQNGILQFLRPKFTSENKFFEPESALSV